MNTVLDRNMIDANSVHLTFGSYWDGIFQVPPLSAFVAASSPPGILIAREHRSPQQRPASYSSLQARRTTLRFFFQMTSLHSLEYVRCSPVPSVPPPALRVRC
ncbi:hypothetical protein C8Q74DRAFT_1024420 [Fomes fomentarius]|nr:hypothetical protein C8Q74DRAFT_1024420 [Fomes fomentarius]